MTKPSTPSDRFQLEARICNVARATKLAAHLAMYDDTDRELLVYAIDCAEREAEELREALYGRAAA